MATIVNNPPANQPTSNTGGGFGFLLGVILLLIVAAVFIIWVIPYIGGNGTSFQIPSNFNVNLRQQP